jgi:hypothetical protein
MVPLNTPATAPVASEFWLTQGRLKGIHIGFPRGCYGLVHVQIYHKGVQICPWITTESLHWDNHTYVFPYDYPLTAAPFYLEAVLWNLDDSFNHTIDVGFELLPYTDTDYLAAILSRLEEMVAIWRT